MLQVEKTVWDWELMNDIKPIWQRPSKEVEEDEYKAFYKSFSKVIWRGASLTSRSACGTDCRPVSWWKVLRAARGDTGPPFPVQVTGSVCFACVHRAVTAWNIPHWFIVIETTCKFHLSL